MQKPKIVKSFISILLINTITILEHRRTEVPYSSDEDAGIDMTNDNYSETSGASDLRSNHDDTGM